MRKLATFLAAKGGASNGIRKLGNALLGAGLAVALGFAIADGNPATAQRRRRRHGQSYFLPEVLPS